MLRHFLTAAVMRGRIAVSAPAPYQQMVAHLGLSPVRQTRHDVYGCGRRSEVFTRAFTAADRLHLSRATYFRRLEHGVDRIARGQRERL